MFEFLLKVWGLARPYRGRLLLGVLTGVISGLIEPLLIVTVAFVYGVLFPSANTTSSLLTATDVKDAPALIARLSHPAEPVSQFLASQFPSPDWQALTNTTAGSQEAPPVLVQQLNHALQCSSLYEPQRLAGVKLSSRAEHLAAGNPQGEQLIRLNRIILEDTYPNEIAHSSTSPFAAKLKWAPAFVRDWALSAEESLRTVEESLRTGVRAHPGAVFALVMLIPLVFALRGIFSYLNVYLLQWTAIRAVTDLRVRLFEHIIRLSAGFFNRTSTGQLMARVMNDTGALQNILSSATTTIVKDPVTLIGLVGYLLLYHRELTLISLVVMPVCMLPIIIYNRKIRRSSRAMQTHAAELTSVMAETFSGNRVVKAYNLESTMTERFQTTAQKFIGHYMRIVRSQEIPGPLLEFVGSLGLSLVLLYLTIPGKVHLGSSDFLAVLGSIFMMYRPLKNLTRLHNNLEQARAASEHVFALLVTATEIPEPIHPKPLRAAGAEIHFDSVDFSYGDKPILRGINLKIHPGQLVALVGESGGGKTTLTSLLMRFYDPQKGAIRIGGTDIREVSTRDLRDQIAIVTQQTILFNESIQRNIELGRPGASQADIIAAAKHANAYDFIMEKQGGLDAPAGEKGSQVSGGQAQRIAIARALLKNAPILILDEATSSLDTESEHAVQAALEKLMQGRTTICIAHRLSTIQKADVIVVLDGGRIVESGTHAQLIQQRGIYCRLYEMQFAPNNSPAALPEELSLR